VLCLLFSRIVASAPAPPGALQAPSHFYLPAPGEGSIKMSREQARPGQGREIFCRTLLAKGLYKSVFSAIGDKNGNKN